MRALDIVVHASTRPEPFGRVIIEAMALERAVVTTALGGAAELIEDGVTAVAWTSGTSEELASLISRLVRDPDTRRALGKQGRIRVARDFSRDQMTSGLLRVYDELLGASRDAPLALSRRVSQMGAAADSHGEEAT
jgi:glycosyltransferase involved in cell wall biosynthesis